MHKHEITLDLNSFVFVSEIFEKIYWVISRGRINLVRCKRTYMIYTCHRKVLIYHFDIWSIGNIVVDNSRSYMVHGS